MSIRCKFRLTEVNGDRYVFTTVYDPSIPEDRRFCEATPSGRIEMLINNPVAQQFFEQGQDYYFDATTTEV